jgi:hypothetical protein
VKEIPLCRNKLKNQIKKIVERDKIDTVRHKYMKASLSRLGVCTALKRVRVKVV